MDPLKLLLLVSYLNETPFRRCKAVRNRAVHQAIPAQSLKCFGRSLADESSLKLGEDSPKLSHSAPLRRREVNLIGNAHQSHGASGEAPEVEKRLGGVASQPIEPHDRHRIDRWPASFEERCNARASGAIGECSRAADTCVLNDFDEVRTGGVTHTYLPYLSLYS